MNLYSDADMRTAKVRIYFACMIAIIFTFVVGYAYGMGVKQEEIATMLDTAASTNHKILYGTIPYSISFYTKPLIQDSTVVNINGRTTIVNTTMEVTPTPVVTPFGVKVKIPSNVTQGTGRVVTQDGVRKTIISGATK